MKVKLTLLTIILIAVFVSGCANNDDNNGDQITPTPAQATPTTAADNTDDNNEDNEDDTMDAVTTASIVNDDEAFLNAISANGTWIICALRDFSFEEPLVLEGEFTNGKKDDAGNDIVQRKIALYTQDENRNVTNKFTLTAPQLTISSPTASLQRGTFVGDIYVSAPNFELVDMKVEGNLYFTTAEAQDTFTMDETSTVTGEQSMQEQ
ncbi:hypothetical protein I5677_05790 [Mobilitalea sibirica]|uniref:Lipid/polyisoprenoid-binding YceI-like domain-containing protein n=1 Tax=Mobilitalea sibirica TaxID=1462919 RepID=A0A8J7H1Q5_9FIRM|nr:hypothetical protein [Mobilitalea sibirica]MBH1940408.1 hypothetical protein [Mobilitalea sibirica]